jgi:hypothetical protein
VEENRTPICLLAKMVKFKQTIGRGTRTYDHPDGKGSSWIPYFSFWRIRERLPQKRVSPAQSPGSSISRVPQKMGCPLPAFKLKDTVALTLEARYIHWSCAGINKRSLDLNGVTGMPGLAFSFRRFL